MQLFKVGDLVSISDGTKHEVVKVEPSLKPKADQKHPQFLILDNGWSGSGESVLYEGRSRKPRNLGELIFGRRG